MKQYVVDAFTDKVFAGNPAAVCVMDKWLDDELMQKIAIENNLSETAFCVKDGGSYRLRWFTPGGRLTVEKQGDMLSMDFPAFRLEPLPVSDELTAALGGVKPLEAYMGADILCVLESEAQVRAVQPDQELIKRLDGVCFHITAKGEGFDCVTRSFAPKCNVAEDPVCGRGHCHVIPYWAKTLGRSEFTAYQASKRGGVLYAKLEGERVILAGKAALFSEAEIHID